MTDIFNNTEMSITINEKEYTLKELEISDQDKIARYWLDRPLKEFMETCKEVEIEKSIQIETIKYLASERGKRNSLIAFQEAVQDMTGLKMLIFACLKHNKGMTKDMIDDLSVGEIQDIFEKLQIMLMQDLDEDQKEEMEKKMAEMQAAIK